MIPLEKSPSEDLDPLLQPRFLTYSLYPYYKHGLDTFKVLLRKASTPEGKESLTHFGSPVSAKDMNIFGSAITSLITNAAGSEALLQAVVPPIKEIEKWSEVFEKEVKEGLADKAGLYRSQTYA